ncbi:helix-turn-helix transcriptional regulator [Paraburkholderia sp. 40]|uniref:helix-turn-helix transcriptional regulator n=1 Tax=Paraburkholderia sp. 40 TaxID=2991059 RepID=UPI003D1F4844
MNERLLRRAEVEQRIGLTGSTIYLKIAQGKFPKPIKVGVAAVRWRESEVNQWIADCAAGTLQHDPDSGKAQMKPPRKAKRQRSET